jgi:hypothetical protein
MAGTVLDAILTVVGATVGGALINKFSNLMGFRLTATCFGLLAIVLVWRISRSTVLLEYFGPYSLRRRRMFLTICGATGLVLFVVGGFLFQRNYEELEKQLRPAAGPTPPQPASALPQISEPPTVSTAADLKLQDDIGQLIGRGDELAASLNLEWHRVLSGMANYHFVGYRIHQIEDWRTDVGGALKNPILRPSVESFVLTIQGDRVTGPVANLRSVLANWASWRLHSPMGSLSSPTINSGENKLAALSTAEKAALKLLLVERKLRWHETWPRLQASGFEASEAPDILNHLETTTPFVQRHFIGYFYIEPVYESFLWERLREGERGWEPKK